MFIDFQKKEKVKYYEQMLGVVGSLSGLFSESNEPYIQYRIAENLFCKSFDAENLSRTDCSADASKGKMGVGIKTFLDMNGASMQKVAEFNSEHSMFRNLGDADKILKLSQLRNERIETTKRIFALDKMIYHCIARKNKGIVVYETLMDSVDTKRIKNIKAGKNVICFEDGLNEYSFNISKSTLYKRFRTENVLLDFNVDILKNPFEALESLLKKAGKGIVFAPIKTAVHIFLPLYSMKNEQKYVPEKSGLNQWNASGRQRNPNEVYIQIPAWIHKTFPKFFPARETSFTLLLPNREEMSAKVCQDGSKALMSKHNADLGKWILRDVLGLKEEELLTYEKLERIGLDSVVIYKVGKNKFDIDFTSAGSYERFKEDNQ